VSDDYARVMASIALIRHFPFPSVIRIYSNRFFVCVKRRTISIDQVIKSSVDQYVCRDWRW